MKMEIKVAERMKTYEEGIFQILNEKKKGIEAKGSKVYNLSVGTPDFPPAEHIVEAVVEAAKNPSNYKYALGDLPELIESVRRKFITRYGVSLETDEIISVYGSQEGIAHIGLTICNSGDKVLVPNPGYPIFTVGPTLANAELACYELRKENAYLPDLKQLEEQLDERTKFMIVSYPLNPICKAAPKSFYEELIPWAIRHNLIIIHDNAYSDIIYDGRDGISILAIPGAKECCVEFYSLSKSFSYTGARVGFLVGNKTLVQNLKKLRSQIDYGTFLPVQYGAIAALNGGEEGVQKQCVAYQERRDVLCQGLRNVGWEIEDSEGTMFAWAKIPSSYTDDEAFVMELMEKTGVLCTPGSSFGSLGKGYVRFALVLSIEEIKEAILKIEKSGILFP